MTQNCSRCGATLPEGARFCTVCGASLAASSARTPVTTPPSTRSPVCPNCGNTRNPTGSNYCIICGQSLPDTTPPTPHPRAADEPTISTTVSGLCGNCGKEVRPGTKFCIYCGSPVTTAISDTGESSQTPETTADLVSEPATTPEVEKPEEVQPIPIPTGVLASLIARGRQLALEDQYAKSDQKSDKLLEELSKAAGDGDFALEGLIDTYINEQTEQDRLDELREKDEVSDRVYERLSAEYQEKLAKMDQDIESGLEQLKGYTAQLNRELNQIHDELETVNARVLIGDIEEDFTSQKTKLTEKQQRLNYALAAAHHILNKEATRRGEAVTRFEITETTLPEATLTTKEPEKTTETSEDESEPSTPSTPPPDAEAGKICNLCGRVTASNAKFCIHCGGPL